MPADHYVGLIDNAGDDQRQHQTGAEKQLAVLLHFFLKLLKIFYKNVAVIILLLPLPRNMNNNIV